MHVYHIICIHMALSIVQCDCNAEESNVTEVCYN